MEIDNSVRKLEVDVGILKTKVETITTLCSKMDQVIERLVNQHDQHLTKVYENIDNRRKETDMDIKELHDRIDTVLDKVQITEKTLLEEIKLLRKEMQEHNSKEKESLDKLLQWKWMVAGGILVLSWLISHTNFDTLLGSLK
jgi:chromosome segregation ATPase